MLEQALARSSGGDLVVGWLKEIFRGFLDMIEDQDVKHCSS
jgi:hypothetical protein